MIQKCHYEISILAILLLVVWCISAVCEYQENKALAEQDYALQKCVEAMILITDMDFYDIARGRATNASF